MKAELRQILDELQIVAAEYQIEVLRRLQKLMPTAQALAEETRDKELGEVLAAVAAKVTLQVTAPSEYFPQYEKDYVGSHFIPLDSKLWEVENYERFLTKRTQLIWKAIDRLVNGI